MESYSVLLYVVLSFLVLETKAKVFSVKQIPENEPEFIEIGNHPKKYLPTWESIDSRPLPAWYDSAKIGIFIHWGVFSVPAFGGAWFWYYWQHDKDPDYIAFMNSNYPPRFTYQDFGPQFTAEFYDPYKWVDLFTKSGAKYIVLTSKHVEGYTLWPSKYSFGWNSMDVGPRRDLVGELEVAVRSNSSLKFGLYHCLFEWFNPLYMEDQANNWTTDEFPRAKSMPELYELVNAYKPDIVWSDYDGGTSASAEYWKAKEFIAWLYNESEVKEHVVTNDRWGAGCVCQHGGFMTCMDRYNPKVVQKRKWENCFTTDRNWWAFRRNAQIVDFLSPEEIIATVVETVACGGNVLINVGPTKEGIIVPIQEERLLQLGEWLGINGDAIYETVPWTHQNDTVTPRVWYTSKPMEKKIFGILLDWPITKQINLGAINGKIVKSIELLGTVGKRSWTMGKVGILVEMPELEKATSKWAWVLVVNTV